MHRLGTNFCGLNAQQPRIGWSSASILEICAHVKSDFMFYVMLDFFSGYLQIPAHHNSKSLLALICPFGKLVYNRDRLCIITNEVVEEEERAKFNIFLMLK